LNTWTEDLKAEDVRIVLGYAGDRHVPYYTTIGDRLLAFIWEKSEWDSINAQLVKVGLARLDVRPSMLKLQSDSDKFALVKGKKLFPDEIKEIVNSQKEAAKLRRGWWNTCDPFKDSAIAIAAINFWDDEQVVYMMNRGNQAIPLTGFALSDKGGNVLPFSDCSEDISLEAQQEMELHVKVTDKKDEDNKQEDCQWVDQRDDQKGYWIWTAKPKHGTVVWNESPRENSREVACLLIISDAFQGECKLETVKTEKPVQDNNICYAYQYPPNDGQTQSYSLAEACPKIAE
jgi:hypothetical protein